MRPFNLFDGIFLILFYCKFTGQGPAFSWWFVFLGPFLAEYVWVWICNLSEGRIKFALWQWFLKRRMKRAGDKARREVEKQFGEVIKKTSTGQTIKTKL